MKYKSSTLLILFLTMSIQFARAQLTSNKYIIFTFEYFSNKSPHGTQVYYWIQSVDSLNRQNPHLSKLILSGYSVSELQDCCSGKSINPYTSTSTSTNLYNFPQKYYMVLDSVERIIKRHRKRIQVAHKMYENKFSETTKIYITPIQGVFCQSKFAPLRDREMIYNGSISAPYANLSFYQGFWGSEEYKFVIKRDYSKFMYSTLPPN